MHSSRENQHDARSNGCLASAPAPAAMSRAVHDDDDRDDDEFSNPDDDGNSPMGRGHGGGAEDDFDEFEDSVAGGGEPSPGGKGSTQVLKNQTYDEAMDLSESDGESLQPSPVGAQRMQNHGAGGAGRGNMSNRPRSDTITNQPYDEEMELSSEGSVDDRDDDDGGSPDGGRGVDPATSMRQQMNSSVGMGARGAPPPPAKQAPPARAQQAPPSQAPPSQEAPPSERQRRPDAPTLGAMPVPAPADRGGDDDDEDGGGEDGGGAPVPEGLYDPAKYANLPVSAEIKELFQHITRYKAHNIELETRMRPFIPDYIPAVGDIDPFIKIPRPDGKTDNLGLVTLDEPASVQSDPTVLTLQLRAVTKCARALPTALPTVDPPAPPRPIARALSLLWSTAPQLLTGAFPPPPYRLPQVVGRAADARALGGTRREGPEGHHRLDQLHLGPASAQARAVGSLFEADARYREPDADMAGPH